MTAVVDTSFLFALANRADRSHALCAGLARTLTEQLVLPMPVLPEIAYLLDARLGHHVMRQFMRQVLDGGWLIEGPLPADLTRAVDLLDTYADTRLDFVDASIIAMAERLHVERVLTLDRCHFRTIRPRHCAGFELLP